MTNNTCKASMPKGLYYTTESGSGETITINKADYQKLVDMNQGLVEALEKYAMVAPRFIYHGNNWKILEDHGESIGKEIGTLAREALAKWRLG